MAEDAHVPITEATMVTTGNKHAIANGGMDAAWRVWMRLPNDQKTWVRWKNMSSGAFLEKRELFRLTGIAYNGIGNQAAETEMGNTMIVTLENLLNADVQKNNIVERLVISHLSLSASLAARNTEIDRLLTVITNLSTGGGGGGGGGGGINNGKATGTPWDPIGYFWRHGFKVRFSHISAMHNKRKDGHKTHLIAKQGDIQGGCKWNRTWKTRVN